jgi:predicted phage terminase large subunit-like protein
MPRKPPAPQPEDRIFQDARTIAEILREKKRAEQMVGSLREFGKEASRIIEPGNPLVGNWHIDALSDHFEAVMKREILRLIINISPRSWKSTLLSVIGPAWWWLNHPEEKFGSASYSKVLSNRDSRRTRNLVMSPWYQQRWADKFALSLDQNEKGRFENDKGGFRIAFSVEGGILGEGASALILDDPNDLNQMEYPEYRQKVKDWYSNSCASRYINPKTDVRILVQQRSSYGNDLTAYLSELGGWEQLVIPNEYDGRKTVTSIGWSDPRHHVGELMHPERLGPAETAKLKVELGPNYPGQYNQIPSAEGSEGLKKEWFNFYNSPGIARVDENGEKIPVRITAGNRTIEKMPVELPDAFEQVIASWDMAFKDAEKNDFVAGHVWARFAANCYLLLRDHAHRNFFSTLNAVRRVDLQIKTQEKLVEDAANGRPVIETLQNEIPGIIPVQADKSKFARVSAISGYVEAGNVYLPNPDLYPWVWDLLQEFSDGRSAKHDDDTDAMTQALKRLFDNMANAGAPEFRVQPRLGEPQTACHISNAKGNPPSEWRRYVAIVPGESALWFAESPVGSLLVFRELAIDHADAIAAGRKIAEVGLGDVLERAHVRDISQPQILSSYDLFMPKAAFAALEPVGSYADLLEHGILNYTPDGADAETMGNVKRRLKEARFRSDMVEEEESALDRLRSLLAFKPPDFEQVQWDRKKALALSVESADKFADYLAAVEGSPRGEWPRLKIYASCPQLISQIGGFRRDKIAEAPTFVRALLLGVCVPPAPKPKAAQEVKWPQMTSKPRIMPRRFACR